MVPRNPINAMAEGNMLQIIVFALLFGLAMALVRQAGRAFERLLSKDVNDEVPS